MKQYMKPTLQVIELRPEEKAIAHCNPHARSHTHQGIWTCKPPKHEFSKGKS